jgi:hypothetical protein
MTALPPSLRPVDRLAAFALAACMVLALCNLPREELPLRWILCWTLPAALLGFLFPLTRQLWQRAALAIVLQGGAIWVALALGGPLSRPAALACTILPPMAFVGVRRQDSDPALGLFLSFCVLLVGIILDGVDLGIIAGYGLAACLCLRCETHQAARFAALSTRNVRDLVPATRTVLLTGLLVTAPCLLAAFAIERTLGIVPSPSRSAHLTASAESQANNRRSAGLGDSFVLDGGQGVLANLTGEQLVRATMSNGRSVPGGLYLRSSCFAMAGLDRWQTGTMEFRQRKDFELHLRAPTPGVPLARIELERYQGARGFVFAPPGTCDLLGLDSTLVDFARESLRPSGPARADLYEAAYQTLSLPDGAAQTDPRAASLGLLELPGDFDRAPFDALLDQWQARGSAAQVAERIAAGLAQLCRYDRQEPAGPYNHALQNFLFAPQDRHGYCMHFASAAALMLRLRGIPCRIGVGLYGGEVDRQDPSARVFGSQHAHAWVEIPYEGLGFVVFDPTPAVERGARMQSTLVAADEPEPTPQGQSNGDLLGNLLAFLMQPWLLGLLLALAVAVCLRPQGSHQPYIAPTPPTARNARRLLARILRALGEAGLPRQRGQTLELFSRDLAARQCLATELRDAFRAYQEVRFGGRPFDQTREQQMLHGLSVATTMKTAADAGPDLASSR